MELCNFDERVSQVTRTTPVRVLSSLNPCTKRILIVSGFLNYCCLSTWWILSSDRLIINFKLFSYSKAFVDGPRNFDPWSNDGTCSEPVPSSYYHTTTVEGRLSSRQI
ncbi:hypothetical protein TNCV_1331301 [Trichonephila clavipes]|nr:hypothetical protein TNCV_1331301 [Trichonephila clavipes]